MSQPLKIALAQQKFQVGAVETNVRHMVALAEEAKVKGADLIVFSELALIGYPPEDLLYRANLSNRVQKALQTLAQVEGIAIVVGYPHLDNYGCFNSVAILEGGRQRGFYHKQVLPNSSVFDEKRYFTEGKNSVCFDYQGYKIGLLVCEDLWTPEPIKNLKDAEVDLVITLNASPFEQGKQQRRKAVIEDRIKETGLPILYVNAVGSQDDLVFDGGSMAYAKAGDLAYEMSRFEPGLGLIEFNGNFSQAQLAGELSAMGETYYALVVGLREYVKATGFQKVLIGLSGGIDSALTLCLAADALGSDNVHAVMMPFEYTSEVSVEDAETLAKTLKVNYSNLPIFDAYAGMMSALGNSFEGLEADATEENLQARLRGTLLMALSNKFGHLVLATGNKSELAVGYCTLYGDMCGGYAPLKDVYKTQVYELANYRNSLGGDPLIPERIITRPPTAELRPDQTDQDSLPDYEILDQILKGYVEQSASVDQIIDQGSDQGIDAKTVKRIVKLVDANEYKRRQGAIGPKITPMAFGRERRYPIMNHWLKGMNE